MRKPQPTLDTDGYPTNASLRRIKAWDAIADPVGLVEFVEELWSNYGSFICNAATGYLELHTGGWSGNEDIIEALGRNKMFWLLYWQRSERGGHYWFTVKKVEA